MFSDAEKMKDLLLSGTYIGLRPDLSSPLLSLLHVFGHGRLNQLPLISFWFWSLQLFVKLATSKTAVEDSGEGRGVLYLGRVGWGCLHCYEHVGLRGPRKGTAAIQQTCVVSISTPRPL